MKQPVHPASSEAKDSRQKLTRDLTVLALLSLLVGVATGLVCGVFRILLDDVDRWRTAFLIGMHEWKLAGMIVGVLICATAVALAAWLVRRFSPYATGSGIPHVEAVLSGELPPAPPQLLFVKFFGGLLALGAGLALGREAQCANGRVRESSDRDEVSAKSGRLFVAPGSRGGRGSFGGF